MGDQERNHMVCTSTCRLSIAIYVACFALQAQAVDVSIAPRGIAARLGHGDFNFTAKDTSNITYHNIDLNIWYQLRFWDYNYDAPTNFGGLTFDQTTARVSYACQPPGWSPAVAVVSVDGHELGMCVGGSNIMTTNYSSNSSINITISKPTGPLPPTPPAPAPPAPGPGVPSCNHAEQNTLCEQPCGSDCRGYPPGFASAGCVPEVDCATPPSWAIGSICTCAPMPTPTTPTPAPTLPTPGKACKWQTANVKCAADADCGAWAAANCASGEVEFYCKSNGFCNFKAATEDAWVQ